jgi:hypothetical protein
MLQRPLVFDCRSGLTWFRFDPYIICPELRVEIPLRSTLTMRRSLRALDLVNLLQADVGAGLGPFLAIYLMASRGWKPEMIGLALAAQGYASRRANSRRCAG